MLYWLLYQKLFPYFPVFRLFHFVTFRCAFASMTAMLIGLLIGPFVIDRLRQFQIGQFIREDGPQSHLKKGGTPTMGGVLICISILVPTLLWANLTNPYIWLVMFSTLAFGGIGFTDDYIKVVKKRSMGLTAWQKLALQFLASGAIAITLLVLRGEHAYSTRLMVPFVKKLRPDLIIGSLLNYPHLWPLAFVPFVLFVMLVITGSSNAVNLTDGLDGLAIGCALIVTFVFLVFTYLAGNVKAAAYLEIPYVNGAGELTVFCAALIGAGLGFLWFNCHPAQVFMGDTGSLALGGAFGLMAVLIHQPLMLLIAGGVFVLEAVSVMMQTTWFKFTRARYGTGRRIFRMAPLHHHFEKLGWYESQVVMRFYILCFLFAVLALATLKLR